MPTESFQMRSLMIKIMRGSFSETKKTALFCRYVRRGIRLVFR